VDVCFQSLMAISGKNTSLSSKINVMNDKYLLFYIKIEFIYVESDVILKHKVFGKWMN